jgi:hypothetical protein
MQFSSGRQAESRKVNDVRSWMLQDFGSTNPSGLDVPSWLNNASGAVLKQTEVMCARCDFKDEGSFGKKSLLDSRPAFTGKYSSKFEEAGPYSRSDSKGYQPALHPHNFPRPTFSHASYSVVPSLQTAPEPSYFVFPEYRHENRASASEAAGNRSRSTMDRRQEERFRGSDWNNPRGMPNRIKSKTIESNPFADEAVSISETTSDCRSHRSTAYDPSRSSFQLTAEVVELSSGSESASVLTTV